METEKYFDDEEFEVMNSIADEVFSKLSEEDKAYLREHPSPWEYHFGLGLHIRNNYLYPNKDDPKYGVLCWSGFDADCTSGGIIELIIEKAKKEKEL